MRVGTYSKRQKRKKKQKYKFKFHNVILKTNKRSSTIKK